MVPVNEKEKLKSICDYCIKTLLYNHLESFRARIVVDKSARRVFEVITADVSKWWGGKDFSGQSKILNDEFVIHHQGAHYSKQKLVEVIPDKKVVWQVTEGTLSWLKNNQQEWTETKMIFEIRTELDQTILDFMHYGLVPTQECYSACERGWSTVIKDWLFGYIQEGKISDRLPR